MQEYGFKGGASFFMSCEVLFGFNEGSEWGVSHYLFEKP